MRSCGGLGTLDAEMQGGAQYGKQEESVQVLDIGAGAGVF